MPIREQQAKILSQTEKGNHMKPVIGLTPSHDSKQHRYQINDDYMQAVIRAGALPLVLPLTEDRETLDEACSRLDGLLLTGGADPSPSLYGEETLPVCGETDSVRDEAEMYLIKKCVRENIPFLAICRGFEIMIAAAGGTLYQDVETQRPDSLLHPRYEVPAEKVHGVSIEEGTMLRELCGTNEIKVNSRHHQGAKDVPEVLTISARAEDGLPEGVELSGHPFAIGVQWHPETLSAQSPEAQALFDALARQAETRHLARSRGDD